MRIFGITDLKFNGQVFFTNVHFNWLKHTWNSFFPKFWQVSSNVKFHEIFWHWNIQSVAYLRGPCASPPPPFDRTAVIFITILGLFLAPYKDEIAATSDQMRFFYGRKML